MSNTTPDHSVLRQEIDVFVQKLNSKHIDLSLIERLKDSADNLDSPSAEWLSSDIYKVFNPALLLEQLRSFYRGQAGYIGVLEIIRNVLVLAPIFLTWLALSQSSSAYRNAISANPNLITEPFLLQWEKGFGGQIGYLTFSHVALLDTILLAIIIVTTFIVHVYQNSQVEKNDRDALYLTTQYDELLWKLSKAYSKHTKSTEDYLQLTKQMKDVVNELHQRGDDFQNLLTAEQDRLAQLAKLNQQQFADMKTVIGGFQSGAAQLSNFSKGMQKSLGTIGGSTQQLNTTTQQLASLQIDLNKNLHGLQGRISSSEIVIQGISQTLTTNFTDLNYAAHVELTQMNQHTAALNNQTTTLATRIQDLVNNQTALQQFIQEETKNNALIAKTIEQVSLNFTEIRDTYKSTFGALVNTNQQLVQAYKEMSGELNGIKTSINQSNNMANQINNVSAKIEQVGHEISGATSALTTASTTSQANSVQMLSMISKLVAGEPPVKRKRGWFQ